MLLKQAVISINPTQTKRVMQIESHKILRSTKHAESNFGNK